MPAKLNKTLKRVIDLEEVETIIELSPTGFAFRLPGKRTRARISWNQVLNLVPHSEWCKDANKPLRVFLGIRSREEKQVERKIKKEVDKTKALKVEIKELKKNSRR